MNPAGNGSALRLVPLGGLGEFGLKLGVRFHRLDERDSGSAGQVAARQGPFGSWRESEWAHDGESAEILGISARTANSWWAYARAWLKTELSDSGP